MDEVYSYRAYVLIKVSSHKVEEIYKSLSVSKSIVMVDMVYGPFDIIAVIQANDQDELGSVILQQVRSLEGVDETVTCLGLHKKPIVN